MAAQPPKMAVVCDLVPTFPIHSPPQESITLMCFCYTRFSVADLENKLEGAYLIIFHL
jgi:hypothetical protein